MAAFSARCCMGDLLFQSLICFVNWSIKSRPVLPYGTKKVFFLHVVTSLYASSIVAVVIVIIPPSKFRPQLTDAGKLTVV